jgi:hypothetical protein
LFSEIFDFPHRFFCSFSFIQIKTITVSRSYSISQRRQFQQMFSMWLKKHEKVNSQAGFLRRFNDLVIITCRFVLQKNENSKKVTYSKTSSTCGMLHALLVKKSTISAMISHLKKLPQEKIKHLTATLDYFNKPIFWSIVRDRVSYFYTKTSLKIRKHICVLVETINFKNIIIKYSPEIVIFVHYLRLNRLRLTIIIEIRNLCNFLEPQ